MTKIVVRFPDPMRAVLDILRATLPAVTFGTVQPEEMASSPLPYVMVRLDGSFRSVVTKSATVRISAWASTESAALDLAESIESELLGYRGGAKVRSIAPLTGAFPTFDPDYGAALASFTVAVRLRPLQVVPSGDGAGAVLIDFIDADFVSADFL